MFYCKNCKKEYPNKWIIKEKTYYIYNYKRNSKGKRCRTYCYNCRPPDDKTRQKLSLKLRNEKKCSSCGKIKPIGEFRERHYKDMYKRILSCACSECKECERIRSLKYVQTIKRQCIEYKGGKCQKCGYNKCDAALHFHHRNPEEKSYNLSMRKHLNFEETKKELDKCDILCANCHAETQYENIEKLI